MERSCPKCAKPTQSYYLCDACVIAEEEKLKTVMSEREASDFLYDLELDAWYAASGY